MKAKNLAVLAFACLMIAMPLCSAASVSGNVYDSLLNRRVNSIVEIDTQPAQRVVAKDGSYSFSVPKGSYTIDASYSSGGIVYSRDSVEVTVDEDGEYTVDLILFPTTEEEEELFSEAESQMLDDVEIPGLGYYALFYIAVLAAVAYIIYRSINPKKRRAGEKEPSGADEAEEILRFIRKEGGRTTQKDIRKNFPQSEAKVSLVISDLEDRGKVRKIKKGRGNIIVLNQEP